MNSILRGIFSTVLLALILATMIPFAFYAKPASAAWRGKPIYIRADGSLDPLDAPIITLADSEYHWAFASMNPSSVEDDALSNGATGVAFWAYKAPGNDVFSHPNSLHSFHVNVALQKPKGATKEPSFHFGFLVSPWEPDKASPSIWAGLSNGTVAEGSTTRWDIKIPRGDVNSRCWFAVIQDGQDSEGYWKWTFWLYVLPEGKWYNVTTVHVDSPYIGRSPNINAEIAEGGGVSACNDRFTPVTFSRVHVLKDGQWQYIPFLVVDYTRNEPPFEDCQAMDWDIVDSEWAVASTKGRDTPRGVEWNLATDPSQRPSPQVPSEAKFKVSQLTISPREVKVGEKVDISAVVENVGNAEGTYSVTLKVNGTLVDRKNVTLAPGRSTLVTFTVVEDEPGIYIVELDGLAGEFRVLKPPTFVASNLKIEPKKVNIGEEVSVVVNVTNVGDLSGTYKVILRVNGAIVETKDIALEGHSSTLVTFTISKDKPGKYVIDVNGLKGYLLVKLWAPASFVVNGLTLIFLPFPL